MTFSSTPFPFQEDGTLIMPGHGRLCATTEVVDYRDMVSIIRDRVQDLIKKGKTLEQIQQADPTAGLPAPVRIRHRRLDDAHVCRGDLQGTDGPRRCRE